MKTSTILYALSLLLIFTACQGPTEVPKLPDPDPEQDCSFYDDNPDWTAEDFKRDYKIGFTVDYEGGISGFEGNIFSKNKQDSSAIFFYAYCGPLWCPDFGDTLLAPIPTEMHIRKLRMQYDSILAPYTQTIYQACDSLKPLGVLYYTDPNGSGFGNFYMGNPDSMLLEAVDVQYRAGMLPEVFTILSTIEEK